MKQTLLFPALLIAVLFGVLTFVFIVPSQANISGGNSAHATISDLSTESVPDSTSVTTPTIGGKWSDYAMQITPAADIKSAESIPAYPAAQQVTVTPSGFENQPAELRFLTDDSLDDVRSFYALVLSRLGWLVHQNERDPSSVRQAFVWMGQDETVPYRLNVAIAVFDGCRRDIYSTVADDSDWIKKRCVHIVTLRQPYASRVPLYPDAREVITSETLLEIRPPFSSRTTRYLTSATPEELTQFYTKMLEYGWRLENGNNAMNSIQAGLIFSDPTIDDREAMQPQVQIVATKTSDGVLEVTMTARGPELRIEQVP